MELLKCPYCLKTKEKRPLHRHKKGDAYWCVFCAKPSFFSSKSTLVKKTKPQLQKFYEDGKYLDSEYWLPEFEKNEIRFVVVIFDECYNPYHRNFKFSERYITMMYHKFGIMPQVGDVIESEEKQENKILNEEYIVIGKQWGVNVFNECLLIVVPEEHYLKNFKK